MLKFKENARLTLHLDIRIFCVQVIILLSDVILLYRYKIQTLFQFYIVVKDLNIFLKCFGEVTPLVFENNFRLKSEKFQNIEDWQKVRYSYIKKSACEFLAVHVFSGLGHFSSP